MTSFFIDAFLALALGGLVGLERERAGKALVGVRSFAATSLFGYLLTLLKGELMLAVGFSAVAALAAVLYYYRSRRDQRQGITTVLMLPFCYLLGVLVGSGLPLEAGAAAIAVTFLLVEKRELHALVRTVNREEVIDILAFAVATFILFPLLPSGDIRIFGMAFNLQYSWAVVVVISAISFLTHFLIKYVKEHALEYAAFFGGVVSSLGTLSLFSARLRDQETLVPVLALVSAGALTGDLVLIATVNPSLFEKSALPLLLILASFAAVYKAFGAKLDELHVPAGRHPLSLKFIAEFAALFLLTSAAMNALAFSEQNLYAASFASGLLSSTSAIASVAYLFARGSVTAHAAATSFVVAVLASMLAKCCLLALQHPSEKKVWAGFAIAAAAGAFGLWMLDMVG